MKVKVISDGTPYGAKVVDAETGATIQGVKSARISLTPEATVVDLELAGVEIDVTSLNARFLSMHPVSKKLEEVEQIVFKDGTIRGFA